jgi:hypothetical protein
MPVLRSQLVPNRPYVGRNRQSGHDIEVCLLLTLVYSPFAYLIKYPANYKAADYTNNGEPDADCDIRLQAYLYAIHREDKQLTCQCHEIADGYIAEAFDKAMCVRLDLHQGSLLFFMYIIPQLCKFVNMLCCLCIAHSWHAACFIY